MQPSTEVATLASAVDDLTARGFTEHFMLANDRLRGVTSGETFRTTEVVIAEYHRFEGVSDPGDMSIVYGIETRSGIRGTLVDAFGVYADPRVGAFVKEVAFRRPRQDAPRVR
jgi:hypothetical protein